MAVEADLERAVCQWAVDHGGEALKLKIDGERGFPDRTIFLPGGKILIAELKRPGKNKRSEQQKRRVAWLQSLGFAAEFVESMDDLERLYDQ